MSIRAEAEENLRVIRSLMEKATVYRAISAPGALIAGASAIAVAAGALWPASPLATLPGFASLWFFVLLMTAASNLWLLRRDAQRRGERFVSQGMRLALRAMLPALLAGGLCVLVESEGGWALVASLWVLLYGVSLLAASHFAPKSICWLGRAFFAVGALLLMSGAFLFDWWRGSDQLRISHLIMGATFGLFHLIYAACTWPRRSAP
jgi:hypothetical protein